MKCLHADTAVKVNSMYAFFFFFFSFQSACSLQGYSTRSKLYTLEREICKGKRSHCL